MTARQQKKLMRYIVQVAPLLSIRGWELILHREPCREGAVGNCYCVKGQKVAHLRVSADFFDFDPEFQRETILHELLHIVHAVPERHVHSYLEDHMPKKAHAVFADLWSDAHEYAVDGLSVAIAPLFPLPELT